MASASAINAGLGVLDIGLTAANMYMQAEAAKAEGRYQKMVADWNARQAGKEAKRVLETGTLLSNRARSAGRRVVGAQRAAMGASGIQLDFGSARAVTAETEALAELDALEIRKDAILQAWGYEAESIQYRYQGQFARLSAKNRVRGTIATGAQQIAQGALTTAYRSYLMSTSTPAQKPSARRDMSNAVDSGPVFAKPGSRFANYA